MFSYCEVNKRRDQISIGVEKAQAVLKTLYMEDSSFSIHNHNSLAWQSHRVVLSLEKLCFLGLAELEAAKNNSGLCPACFAAPDVGPE